MYACAIPLALHSIAPAAVLLLYTVLLLDAIQIGLRWIDDCTRKVMLGDVVLYVGYTVSTLVYETQSAALWSLLAA